jgi:hypothetical protein
MNRRIMLALAFVVLAGLPALVITMHNTSGMERQMMTV